MRHILLLLILLGISSAQARLPNHIESSSEADSAILALDNSLENYYGNNDSAQALESVRRHLRKVQELGVATKVPSVLHLDDRSLKKTLDEKSIEVAGVSPRVRECSYVVMTVLALSQGKCPRRPEIQMPPPVEIHQPTGTK